MNNSYLKTFRKTQRSESISHPKLQPEPYDKWLTSELLI